MNMSLFLFVDLELNKGADCSAEAKKEWAICFSIEICCTRSDVEEDGGLVGELHFFDTEDGSVHLIVNPWQVGDSGALSDSAELVVDGTVTEADPALVGTQVGHGDATQMRADGRAADNAGVAGVGNGGLRLLIELSGGWQGVGLVDLGLGQTTDENQITVPGGLEDFTGGQLCAHHGARDADAHTRIGCAANNVEQGGLADIHLANAQAVCIGMLLCTFNFTHDHARKRWCYRLKFFNLQARHGEGFGELFGREGWVAKLTQPRFRKLHGL